MSVLYCLLVVNPNLTIIFSLIPLTCPDSDHHQKRATPKASTQPALRSIPGVDGSSMASILDQCLLAQRADGVHEEVAYHAADCETCRDKNVGEASSGFSLVVAGQLLRHLHETDGYDVAVGESECVL